MAKVPWNITRRAVNKLSSEIADLGFSTASPSVLAELSEVKEALALLSERLSQSAPAEEVYRELARLRGIVAALRCAERTRLETSANSASAPNPHSEDQPNPPRQSDKRNAAESGFPNGDAQLEHSLSVLSPLHAKLLFSLTSLVGVMFVFYSPAPTPDIVTNVQLFAILCGLGILAFSTAEDGPSFYGTMLRQALIHGPLVALLLFSLHPIMLLVWIGSVILSSIICAVAEKGLSVLEFLYVLWIATGLIILAADTGLVPYHGVIAAQLPIDFGVIHQFVAVRSIPTLLLVAYVLISSIYEALTGNVPTVNRVHWLSPIVARSGGPFLRSIVAPLIQAANFIFILCRVAVTVVWYFVAYLGIYLSRIVKSIWSRTKRLLKTQAIWAPLLRLYGSYLLIYLFILSLKYFGNGVAGYVFSSPRGLFDHIPSVLGLVLAILLVVAIHGAIWHHDFQMTALRGALAACMLVLAFSCSSLPLYLIRRLNLARFSGFDSIGLISSVTLGILLVIIVVDVLKQFSASSSR